MFVVLYILVFCCPNSLCVRVCVRACMCVWVLLLCLSTRSFAVISLRKRGLVHLLNCSFALTSLCVSLFVCFLVSLPHGVMCLSVTWADPEWGQGVRTPLPEKSQKYRVF